MQEILIGKDIILRKAKESDVTDIWQNVWSDPRLAERMLWQVTEEYEEALDRLQRTIEIQKRFDLFFVALKETDEIIGFAGMRPEEDDAMEEAGIAIARRYQRQGYAREAMELLLELAFEKRGARRFYYSCFSDNEASRQLAFSLGFTYTHTDQRVREHDGFAYDCEHFVLTKEDYEKRKNGESD